MASWMIHLRVADGLLCAFPDLDETAFVVGNIAPDSGVPNEDWSKFTPDANVSHYKYRNAEGKREIDIGTFISDYLTDEAIKGYDRRELSFYLGYYSHLLTDTLWAKNIYYPCCEKHADEVKADKTAFTWKIKEDWYDLDYKYLRDHNGFRAFEIYKNAVGFENDLIDLFARDAFDNRRKYIVSFYEQGKDGLDREYPYLNEDTANAFVADTVKDIKEKLWSITMMAKY